MAFQEYEKVLAATLPSMRSIDTITTDIDRDGSGTNGTVAAIELYIKLGDQAYRRKKYDNALYNYKKARAQIYKLLYPKFNVDSYASNLRHVLLPVSNALESGIINASLQILDVIRPQVVEAESLLGISKENIAKDVSEFEKIGFQESVDIEGTLQRASDEGIALMQEDKFGAAIGVMESSLALANNNTDPSLLAALQLNLAGAQMQVGQVAEAQKTAILSTKNFAKAKDSIGQAQAIHMTAITENKLGNKDVAQRLFKKAADLLGKESTNADSNNNGKRTLSASNTTDLASVPGIKGPFISIRATSGLSTRNTLANNFVVRKIPVGASVGRNKEELKHIREMDTEVLSVRVPGRTDGWSTIKIKNDNQKRQIDKSWNLGVSAGDKIASFEIGAGKRIPLESFIKEIYTVRAKAIALPQLGFQVTGIPTITAYLTHLYAYGLPIKIGDAHHEMGEFKRAEANYIQATKYSYINRSVEGSILWNKLSNNANMWGHALYKKENLTEAKQQYEKLILQNGTVPASYLYTTDTIEVAADDARTLITKLLDRPLPSINWAVAINVLTASQYLQQIFNGLDFYGLALSPIHTFEYLKGISRGMVQEAIQAEREFVNFKTREEGEEATRRDLETAQAMAEAEAEARHEQYLSALEDESAAKHAHDLAVERHGNAISQRNDYQSNGLTQVWAQAASAALGGGEDAYWSEINELANKLANGETISGPGPKLAAAQILNAGRKTMKYELEKMQDNIDELAQSINIAKDQWDGARHRSAASELAYEAAKQRAQMAAASLDAFDNEFFTPDTWGKMADIMRDISKAYLGRAIRIAKLMERAYNFENDTNFKIIKNEYGHGVASPEPGRDTKLLGGDNLLSDIDGFTYRAITTKIRKNSPIKDIISVAGNFPAQFEEFRQTGLLSLETDLYEFDRLHPGFYGQRIESVEVEIVGVLPAGGLNGTLQLGGATRFRKKDGTASERVHQVDTMALSEYTLRNDAFVYTADTGVRGLFQGYGLGATWQIHLPRSGNSFDYRRIFDVRLVIYYQAVFDPLLRTAILQKPRRSDELATLRNFGLRYDFPDSWYAFYQGGVAKFKVDRFTFPMNQKDFKSQEILFRVVTKEGIANKGIEMRITSPTGATGTVTTDKNGTVSSADAKLAGMKGISPMGEWQVEVLKGPSITSAGKMDFQKIYNMQFGLEYGFAYVKELVV